LGARVFDWLILIIKTFPRDVQIQEQLDETFSNDDEKYLSTPQYNGMSMPISPHCQISRKIYKKGRK